MIDASQFSTQLSGAEIGQIEYLIQQSIRGHHVLFDVDSLRKVLNQEGTSELARTLTDDEASSIELHIQALLRQPTLIEKRAYLEKLDSLTYAWVVRTYFNIIENNLYESNEVH